MKETIVRERILFAAVVVLALACLGGRIAAWKALERGRQVDAQSVPGPRADSAGAGTERLVGQLLARNGKAAAGVVVCLCTRELDISDTKFPQEVWGAESVRTWPDGQGSVSFATTDAQGRFSFDKPAGKAALFASTPEGYAIARPDDRKSEVVLRLTEWARLEGVVTTGGRPVGAGTVVRLGTRDNSDDGFGPRLHFSPATTDENGRFIFPRVVAGEHRVVRVGPQGSTGRGVAAHVPAGETAQVQVPVVGPTVRGRVVLPQARRPLSGGRYA